MTGLSANACLLIPAIMASSLPPLLWTYSLLLVSYNRRLIVTLISPTETKLKVESLETKEEYLLQIKTIRLKNDSLCNACYF